MDFIERLVGLSLDGGSGTLEALLLFTPLCAVAFVTWRRRAHLRPS
jgi:hypothetical protein